MRPTSSSSSFKTWLGAALVLALTLFTQPYFGVRHDGVLYLGQVLARLHPDVFARDLFFASGSQDGLSVYSRVFAPLYQLLPATAINMAAVLLAQLACLSALYRLLAPVQSRLLAWSGLLAVALLQHSYGWTGTLGFSEMFLTGRTVAEPLTLWALVALLAGRAAWTWGLLFLAALFHPLMALPGMVIAWLWLCRTDRRWWFAAGVLIPALALAGFGVAPWSALLNRYPLAWWHLVREVNELTVLQNWTEADGLSALADLAVLFGLWRLMPTALARLSGCALVATVLLLTLAALGGDLLHDELLTQLQLWRVLWIVHALALAGTPALLHALWRRPEVGPMTAASAALVLTATGLRWDVGIVPLLIWGGAHVWIWHRKISLSRQVRALSVGASFASTLLIGLMLFLHLIEVPRDEVASLNFNAANLALICLPLPVLAIASWLLSKELSSSGLRLALSLAAAAVVIAACLQWDHRSALARQFEAGVQKEHPFNAWIPPRAQVYWHDQLAAPWALLKRASYYAKGQGAGLLFNQGTALVYGPRWEAFRAIREGRTTCESTRDLLGVHPGDAPCWQLQESEVLRLCRSEHEMDFVIAPQAYSKPPLAVWRVPDAVDDPKAYYLYACSAFR